jgi:hypothetical protein
LPAAGDTGVDAEADTPADAAEGRAPENPGDSTKTGDFKTQGDAEGANIENPADAGESEDPNTLGDTAEGSDSDNTADAGESADADTPADAGEREDPNTLGDTAEGSDGGNPADAGERANADNLGSVGEEANPDPLMNVRGAEDGEMAPDVAARVSTDTIRASTTAVSRRDMPPLPGRIRGSSVSTTSAVTAIRWSASSGTGPAVTVCTLNATTAAVAATQASTARTAFVPAPALPRAVLRPRMRVTIPTPARADTDIAATIVVIAAEQPTRTSAVSQAPTPGQTRRNEWAVHPAVSRSSSPDTGALVK